MFLRKNPLALIVVLVLVLTALILAPSMALADDGGPPPDVPAVAWGVVESLGLGTGILLLVQILKVAHVIPDGWAGIVATGLIGIAYVILLALGAFGVDYSGATVKAVIDTLVILGEFALSIAGSIGGYKLLRAGNVIKPMPGR